MFDQLLYPDNREKRLVWTGIRGTYIAYDFHQHLWIAKVSKVEDFMPLAKKMVSSA
jgi:hypothetical protein